MITYVEVPESKLDIEYNNIAGWLINFIGKSFINKGVWISKPQMGYTEYFFSIEFDNESDAIAFKLRFGL